MRCILFIFSLALFSPVFAEEDFDVNSRSFTHKITITDEDIRESSFTELGELLDSVGLNVAKEIDSSSVGFRGFSVGDVVFFVDGVQVSNRIGSFNIDTFDIFSIHSIEITFGGYSRDLVSPPGAVVNITTMSDLKPKLTFDLLGNTFFSGFDRAQVSLGSLIGLRRSSVGISAHGKFGTNSYRFSIDPKNPYETTNINKDVTKFIGGGGLNYFLPLRIGNFRVSAAMNVGNTTVAMVSQTSLSGIFFVDTTLNFTKNSETKISVSSVFHNESVAETDDLIDTTSIKANFKIQPVHEIILFANALFNFDFLKTENRLFFGFRGGIGFLWQVHENIRIEFPFHVYWYNNDFLIAPKLNVGFSWPNVFLSVAAYPVWTPREFDYLVRDLFRKGQNGYAAEITLGSPKIPLTLSVYTIYARKIVMGRTHTGDSSSELVIVVDNGGKQISLGGKLSADIPITPNFNLKGGYSCTHVSMFLEDEEPTLNGTPISNLPIHNFYLGFNAKVGNLRFYAMAHMYSERFVSEDKKDNLPAYFLVDLSVRYRIQDFDIYLKTNNTLDQYYWESIVTPGENISVTLGAKYVFR